jgi:hypothetical protein
VPLVNVKFPADVGTSELMLMAGVTLLLDTRKWSGFTLTDPHIATASACPTHGPPADWRFFSPICLFEFRFYLTLWLRVLRKSLNSFSAKYTGMLISPYPDPLPDVFCLIVRIFRLMLVLLYICMYVCMCVCVCVCIYIYIVLIFLQL